MIAPTTIWGQGGGVVESMYVPVISLTWLKVTYVSPAWVSITIARQGPSEPVA